MRIFRIVVASPGDVQDERDAVDEVADELNLVFAADRGVRVVVNRWERDAVPGAHRGGPQPPVDEALAPGDADCVVGIFWKRFGTPTAEAGSGTEHEIRAAYRAWEETGRPHLFLYFSQRPYTLRDEAETEQVKLVQSFRAEFDRKGLWYEYADLRQFEKLLRVHLQKLLTKEYPAFEPRTDATRVALVPLEEDARHGETTAWGPGVTEVLGELLRRSDRVQVIPTAASGPADGGAGAGSLRKRLGVDYVVGVSVQRRDDGLDVSPRILEGRDAPSSLRAPPPTPGGLGSVLGGAAERLAERVAPDLPADDLLAIAAGPRASDSAVRAYVRGCDHRRRYNNERAPEHWKQAVACFREAVRLDRSYADALAELGFLILLSQETEGGMDLLERSARYFRQALQIDTGHPVARSELGFIRFMQGEREAGLEECTRSATANPNSVIAQNVLALLWLYVGFYESTIWLTRESVNRLDPHYVYPYTNAALAAWLAGDLDEALEWTHAAETAGPRGFTPFLYRGVVHFTRGELAEAEFVWNLGIDVAPDDVDRIFEVALAWISAARRDMEVARRAVHEHRGDAWLDGAYAGVYASLCAMTREVDLAIDVLEGERTLCSSYRYLVSDPTLAPLRESPRFRELLRERFGEWARHRRRWRDVVPRRPPPLRTPPAEPAGASRGRPSGQPLHGG